MLRPQARFPHFVANSQNVSACKGKINDGVCPIARNPCIALGKNAQEFDPPGAQQPIFPYPAGSIEGGFGFNTAAVARHSGKIVVEGYTCGETPADRSARFGLL